MARRSFALKTDDRKTVVGFAIKTAREWVGLERAHLAAILNEELGTDRFTENVLADMEGSRTKVDAEVLDALADTLQVPHRYLMKGLAFFDGFPPAASMRITNVDSSWFLPEPVAA